MVGHCPVDTGPDIVVVVLGLAGTGRDKTMAMRMLAHPAEERFQHVVPVPGPAAEPQPDVPGLPGCFRTKRSEDGLNE
jgi:hypothetical protein